MYYYYWGQHLLMTSTSRRKAERRFSMEVVQAIGHGSEGKEGIFVRALKISNQRIIHCVPDRKKSARLGWLHALTL
jgi:hypothetical protein